MIVVSALNVHFIKRFWMNVPAWLDFRSSLVLGVCNDPDLRSSVVLLSGSQRAPSHYRWSRKWSAAEVSLSLSLSLSLTPAAINFIKMIFAISLLTRVLILPSITSNSAALDSFHWWMSVVTENLMLGKLFNKSFWDKMWKMLYCNCHSGCFFFFRE